MNEYLLITPLVLLFLIIKKKKNVLALVPLVFYAMGALVGYIMTFNPLYSTYVNVGHQMPSIAANLFIIVCLLISFYPILKSTPKDISVIDINKNNLYAFSSFLIAISLFFIVWMAPHVIEGLSALKDINAYKTAAAEEGMTFARNSPLAGLLITFHISLRPIIVFLFCLSLCIKSVSGTYRFIMGFISIAPPIIQLLATAYRNELVFTGLYFVICYTIFKNYYSEETKRKYRFALFGVFSSILLFLVVFVAILRFGEGGNDFIVYSIERYWGEPFVNFNTMLWGEDNLLYGNKSFVVIRKYLGLSYIEPKSLGEYDYMWNYQYNFFYSFIGDFYMDFGGLGTVAICLLFALILRSFQNRYERSSFFISLNLINFLYISILVRSYFYFVYILYNFLSLVILIIGFMLCHFFVFKKHNKFKMYIRNKHNNNG